MATPSTQSSLSDLTTGMQQLTKSGAGADLKLSHTACQNYLKTIDTFQQALTGYRTQAAALRLGSPGTFPSAVQTVAQLQDAVTDEVDGLCPNLDRYIAYLDELKKTVNAAFTRFHAEDNG